jgi:tetratricopeptide (TPR) repeat protein
MTTVFISYSQDSDEHKDKVLRLADRLCDDGIDTNLDQYQTNPPEGWQLWMEKQIRDSQFVLLVCTETYLKRVMKEDEGRGKGIMWESTIIYSYLYEAGLVNEKFIPVVFGRENTKHIPTPLKPTTFYDVSTEDGYENLYRRLTNQPYTTKPKLGAKKKLPRRERKIETPKVDVFLAKLPSTDPTLFGREDRLKELDAAWKNPKINIVSLVAWGGVGKTALVNKWLSGLGESYGGAERVYGWSFYSQGAAEGRQASADQFIAAALTWFGDPDPTQGSPWDKGERLAELIKAQRTLLILDGLEPLQSPPNGEIKDRYSGLVSLLRELARQNPGLVVISSRLKVDDLKDFRETTLVEADLESLSPEAGREYLAYLGVKGLPEELRQAVVDFSGHALALTLLGRYLSDVYDGDVRKRDLIPRLIDEEEKGGHAKRIMRAYEKWFEGNPELDLLYIMGLFDRPAEKGAIDVLIAAPVIDGLTNKIQGLPNDKYILVLKHLRKARLLAERDIHEPNTFDCHPLLREYFGEKLKNENNGTWQEAHGRLYEYYKTTAKEYPDTSEEMAPLYAAIIHGCYAGKHQKALDEVYWKRVQRYEENFNVAKLGAFSAELSAIYGFFEVPWDKPVGELNEDAKGFVLNRAGTDLLAVGRLAEATQSIKVALEARIVQENWTNAARNASTLSELYLTLGDVMQAFTYAQKSIQLATQNSNIFEQMTSRIRYANVLHQAGRFIEAKDNFHKAEEIQKERQPMFPLLYSGQGYQYCDLLLSQGDYAEVERRANVIFEWRKGGIWNPAYDPKLSIAFDNLLLGRAHLLQSQCESNHPFTESLTYLNRAMDGLRQASQLHYLPLGLLSRAEYYRVIGDLVKAQKDVDEAFTIATRGGMGLHLADCHLEYARLYLAHSPLRDSALPSKQSPRDESGIASQSALAMTEKARKYLATAKEMINKMGYHRRDKEVEELEEQLG